MGGLYISALYLAAQRNERSSLITSGKVVQGPGGGEILFSAGVVLPEKILVLLTLVGSGDLEIRLDVRCIELYNQRPFPKIWAAERADLQKLFS